MGAFIMRIAIVDDVPADSERLRADIYRWAFEHNISLLMAPAMFDSGEALLANFSADTYDVIFLDIYMRGISGMDTAKRIREIDGTCRIIFITTTAEFAVDSYEVDSSWYLVKPYSYEKLSKALNRCGTTFLAQGQFIIIHGKTGEQKLFPHRITWTEYEGRRVMVHFNDGSNYAISISQKDFIAALQPYPFLCSCIKGVIVNFDAVEKLLHDSFLLQGGQRVPISRLKYREVREKFLEYSYAKLRGGRL